MFQEQAGEIWIAINIWKWWYDINNFKDYKEKSSVVIDTSPVSLNVKHIHMTTYMQYYSSIFC